jgi:hypothetical protein
VLYRDEQLGYPEGGRAKMPYTSTAHNVPPHFSSSLPFPEWMNTTKTLTPGQPTFPWHPLQTPSLEGCTCGGGAGRESDRAERWSAPACSIVLLAAPWAGLWWALVLLDGFSLNLCTFQDPLPATGGRVWGKHAGKMWCHLTPSGLLFKLVPFHWNSPSVLPVLPFTSLKYRKRKHAQFPQHWLCHLITV